MEVSKDTEIFESIDEIYNSDSSEDDQDQQAGSGKHKRLLHDIAVITGVPAKRPDLRTEASSEVGEHLWSHRTGDKEKVGLQELIAAVPQSSSLGSLRKQFSKLEKSKKFLDTPLTKQQKERIQRAVGYELTAKDISKWAPTIIQNREAETLTFPMNAYKPPVPTTKSTAVKFRPKNSLEKEIAAVLKGSSSVLERKSQELTEEEEKALQAVDLQEAIARRKELQKMRVLQSYYEMKCKRMKKIKSKKFRRIQRKAEQKSEAQNAKDLTEEETSALVLDVETNRAMERAHLRHRNTSKWAKKLMKKDNKSVQEKQSLHDQLKISRSLTEKKEYEEDSDNEADLKDDKENFSLLKKSSENSDNPWLLGANTKQAVTKKTKEAEDDEKTSNADDSSESENEDDSEDEMTEISQNAAIKRQKNNKSEKPKGPSDHLTSDVESDIEYENVIDINDGHVEKKQQLSEDQGGSNATSTDLISKKKDSFLSVESNALDVDSFLKNNSDVNFSTSTEQQLIVKEAFANDDVMEEFVADKKRIRDQRMPKDIDLTLPGWGEWAGSGIDNEKALKRKRKRFVKKGEKPPPSKDEKLNYVIINEEKNKKLASNQISLVPFPYSSEAQYERSMRQPIGKAWNTPKLTAKLTQPRISTLMGTIIEPIRKVKEVNKDSDNKRPKKDGIIR